MEISDFIKTLKGKTLETIGGQSSFKIIDIEEDIIKISLREGSKKSIKVSNTEKHLKQYKKTKSYKAVDYGRYAIYHLAIIKLFNKSENNTNQNEEYSEGELREILTNRYERNAKARKECLKHHGYSCSICEINLRNYYGNLIENDYAHVHHVKPLSEIGEEYKVDPIKDLIPVCPNCHTMLHLSGASPNALRDGVRRQIRVFRPNAD